MSDVDYEYRGLLAESWDFSRGDPSEFTDRGFFREIVERSGEPILDVGCGTGRLLLEFLEDGFDVDGIDVSPEMVEVCRQKAQAQSLPLTVYTQGIESMDLPRVYRTIIVPSYSFQLVPDLEDAKNALHRFNKHLLPGGTLVLSIWHITKIGTGEWGDWWQVFEMDGYEDGKSLRRWERSMYDSSTHLRHTENRYELLKDGQVVYTEMHSRSPELRNYSLSQIRDMMEAAEFSGVHALSAYSNDTASEDDDTFCIIGKKRKEA